MLFNNNKSTIDPRLVPPERRERRILLHIEKDKNKTIAIFDILNDHAVSFTEAVMLIEKIFKGKLGYSILGAVNLDTGAKDIFNILDEKGNIVYKKSTDINQATNLIAIYE